MTVEPLTASPLGRYSEFAAAATALALVVAAVLAHTGLVMVVDTAWLDTSAGLAIGVVLGQRQTTNGAGKIAAAAHERIDVLESQMGATTHPPAANGGV